MAAYLNKVILIGNLGKDPELRVTQSNQSVASFSLATTERFTDKSGQKQERTEWHNIVAWGKTGELCNQYLKKGRSAYIEGKIQTRSWDDKDGVKKYKTEIIAHDVKFLGSAPGAGGQSNFGGDPGPSDSDMPFATAANAGFDSPLPPAAPSAGAPIEDDLPF